MPNKTRRAMIFTFLLPRLPCILSSQSFVSENPHHQRPGIPSPSSWFFLSTSHPLLLARLLPKLLFSQSPQHAELNQPTVFIASCASGAIRESRVGYHCSSQDQVKRFLLHSHLLRAAARELAVPVLQYPSMSQHTW